MIAIAAGRAHSIALKDDGTIVEWGFICGPCPYPLTAESIPGIALAAGDYHGLLLRADGRVFAWGCGIRTPASAASLPRPRAA